MHCACRAGFTLDRRVMQRNLFNFRHALFRIRRWATANGTSTQYPTANWSPVVIEYAIRPNRDIANSERAAWCDKLTRIQSNGHPSGVFVRGSVYEPGVVGQSVSPRAPHYRHPDAPPLTGSFPAPWQSLAKAERQYRSDIKTVAAGLRWGLGL